MKAPSALVARSLLFAALFGAAAFLFSADRLVNMTPNSRSGETTQDAEPTLAVDPNDFNRMAGSAFTWDNLTGAAMTTANAPIYVSTDRGATWSLANIVPSKIGSGFPTGDITLSFSSTAGGGTHPSSWLYGGILSAVTAGYPMSVLRTSDPYAATVMTTLDTHTGNVDQPHTTSLTGGTQDRLYVGFNNGWNCIITGGRTSTLDVSQDAKVTTPAFALDVIEARNTPCQDGFAQVAAPASDGTVYAAFFHDFTGSTRLVVVRDDNWGQGGSPFTALTDSSDTVAGRFVTGTLTLASGTMGQNRLGASNLSIAVDPANSDRVYVAWGDSGGVNSETIHVRRSINRGVDWSDDLMTVTNALNPQIAIDDIGIVGVLFQTLVSGKWETRLARSNNIDATGFTTPGILLAKQSATTPAATYFPYIGDYASLQTAGSNFVGIFCASNFPDKANFKTGVEYQREVDWTAHKLYTSAAHTTEVAPSIDPFFFEINTTICNKSPAFCNICVTHPHLCYPIYDPLWWTKCPMCGLDILVRLEDDWYRQVDVYDTRGKRVGRLEKLAEPVVEKGVSYNYKVSVKAQKGTGYLLKAQLAKGKKEKGDFAPPVAVKQER